MELRNISTFTLATLHILLFIKSHMLVVSGHSAPSDGQSPSSSSSTSKRSTGPASSELLASKSIQRDLLGLDPVANVFYPQQKNLKVGTDFPEAADVWRTGLNSWGGGSPGSETRSTSSSDMWGESGPRDKKWTEFHSFGKRSGDDAWKDIAERSKQDFEEPEKKWRDSGMAVWGKRDSSLDKKWKEMQVWGKRDEIPVKKWKEMQVWGKRDETPHKKWKEMQVWGKRDEMPDKRWKEMQVWGKRDEIPFKKWKEMQVWGKRGETPVKKWKEMQVWGKRDDTLPDKKWQEMAVWGKRDGDMQGDSFPHVIYPGSDFIKRWKEMAVWGKRSSPSLATSPGEGNVGKKWKEVSVWGKRSVEPGLPEIQKKWREMQVWGKRSSLDFSPDKKWGEMAVWGKRAANLPDFSKKWKSMAAWGKRRTGSGSAVSTFRPIQNWRHIDNVWGKRPSWRRTGFTSWGKRSSPQAYNKGQITARQERFQRRLHELRNFLLSSEQQKIQQEFPREESSAEKTPAAATT